MGVAGDDRGLGGEVRVTELDALLQERKRRKRELLGKKKEEPPIKSGLSEQCVCAFTIMLLSELSSWQLGCSQHWLTTSLALPTTTNATKSHIGHILLLTNQRKAQTEC